MIPLPENVFDAATLARCARRRTELQSGCPRHPDADERELIFYKELLVGTEGDMNMVAVVMYADACKLTVRVNTEDEPSYDD